MSKEYKVIAMVMSVLHIGQTAKKVDDFNNVILYIVYNVKKV